MKDRWPNLPDLIDCDGAIAIGEIPPIISVAVAPQGRQVHAMLTISDGESLDQRDAAVAKAVDDGIPTDEINR